MKDNVKRSSQERSFLIYRACGQVQGVRVESVIRVLRAPSGPQEEGLALNFQGEVIPVVDLSRELGAPQGPTERLIVVRGGDVLLGFLVQWIEAVRSFPIDQVSPPPGLMKGRSFFEGILRSESGPIVLVDLASLAQAIRSSRARKPDERGPRRSLRSEAPR